jgi:cell division protein FtsL
MAAAARDMRYRGKQAVNGSLAYDLDYAVRERELRHAGEVPRTREKAKVHEKPRVLIRARQYISPLTVLSIAAVLGLSLLVLLSYVQLTQLSAETVKLQNQLQELDTENANLTAQYQRMFDMASVKEAAEAAGMSKPSSTQMSRLDLSAGDSAVAYLKKEPGLFSRLLSSLHGGVYAVVEYFD